MALRVRDRRLTGVAEWRVAEVVPQADRLDQILVEPQRPPTGPRVRVALHLMSKRGAVVAPQWSNNPLRLILEPPECLGMQDSTPAALEVRPRRRLSFPPLTTPCIPKAASGE